MITSEELEGLLDLSEIHRLSLDQLRVVHHHVTGCLKLLSDYRSEIESFMFDLLPKDGKPYVLEGYAPVQRKAGGTYDSYDGLAIRLRLVAQVADELIDKETGELPPVHQIVAQSMSALADCAGTDNKSQKWRALKLKARGLQPKEFAHWKPGKEKRIVVVD